MSRHQDGEGRSLWREALNHPGMTLPAREEIALRAYVKYLAYGERSRDAVRDWLEAEAELTKRREPADRRSGNGHPQRSPSGSAR